MGILAISDAEQRILWFSYTHSCINLYICLFSTYLQLILKDNARGKFIMGDRELCSPLVDFVWHSHLGLLKKTEWSPYSESWRGLTQKWRGLTQNTYLSVFLILACKVIMELSLPFGIWKYAYLIWNANMFQSIIANPVSIKEAMGRDKV